MVGGEGDAAGALVWYRAPAWERRPIARGQFTTDAALADLDGDGFLDVVACDHGAGIHWYRNPGRDPAAVWQPQRIGAGHAHDVAVGDVTGAGRADVVVCDKQRVTLWYRAGETWRSQVLVASPGEGIALADIDRDGRLDVCFGASWLRNPGRADPPREWPRHPVARSWLADTRVRAADIDGDGRLDLVLSASEGRGRIAWFQAPADPQASPWREHLVLDADLEGVHSLQVGDLDGDGRPDIVAAEMHTSAQKRVLLCYQDAPDRWRTVALATTGSHNLQVADLGADGDLDLVGKNYSGQGRCLEVWENLSADPRPWRYIALEPARAADQSGKLGLCFCDVDGDGLSDVVAGGHVFRNPGGDLTGPWAQQRLPGDVDAHVAIDVDRDRDPDLLAFDDRNLVWLERRAGSWHAMPVAPLPPGRTQGSTVGQLIAGGRDEVVFTRGNHLLFVTLRDDPERAPWPVVQIADDNEEEGIAHGDIDGDGDLDVFAVDRKGHQLVCYRNPGGDGRGRWTRATLGWSRQWLDRLALADVYRDGRLCVVVTEETQDWDWNADLFVFSPSAEPAQEPWAGRSLGRLRSINSMAVADVDGDGHPDILVAEHTDQAKDRVAADNMTVLLRNDGTGRNFTFEWIDIGPRSSHLGMKVCDLDRDGDLDLVSLAWRQPAIHLWRNDRPQRR